MILKGVIKGAKSVLSLAKILLCEEGIKAEEDNDTLYIEQEINPCELNKRRVTLIFERLKELPLDSVDIGGYSIVEIYRFKYQRKKVN